MLELTIDPEGRVGCRTAGNPDTATLLGQLTLHRFSNPGGLVVTGSCFRTSDASGAPRTGTPGTNGLGQVRQGWLEQSNVECATETLALQVVEREHEALRAAMRELQLVP